MVLQRADAFRPAADIAASAEATGNRIDTNAEGGPIRSVPLLVPARIAISRLPGEVIHMPIAIRLTLLLSCVAVLNGCTSIGVATILRDRPAYNEVIADTWKQQTLLNIVKLRYFDTPTFLDISSVISSYQLQGEISLEREFFPRAPTDTNRTLGLSGTYIDRPTISYAPLTGERFVNNLLRPIPPQAVFAMVMSGHQADFIFRAAVRGINDVYSFSAAPARARTEDPDFSRIIEALQRIQRVGALGMRIEEVRGSAETAQRGPKGERGVPREHVTWVFFRETRDERTRADIALLREALTLAPDAKEFRLTFGALRSEGNEIAIFTRSILEILVELSAGVEVPTNHVTEGRVRGIGSPSHEGSSAYPVAKIRVSSERPEDAFSAVFYRNHWFWIDDRDLPSKRVFTFLKLFSSIAETGVAPHLPVLTVPAN